MLVTKTSQNKTQQPSQPSVRGGQSISINTMAINQADQKPMDQSNPNESPRQPYPSITHISQPSITPSQHTQQSNEIEQKTPIEQKGHDSQLTALPTSSDIVSEHDDDDERFQCPISLEQMSDPVFLPSGHTIDRSSANNILKTTRLNPFTQKEINEEDIVPNYSLREELERYKEDKEKIERVAQKNKELNEYIDSIDQNILYKTINQSKDEAKLQQEQVATSSYRPPATNPELSMQTQTSIMPSAPTLTDTSPPPISTNVSPRHSCPDLSLISPTPNNPYKLFESKTNSTATESPQEEHSQHSDSSNTNSVIPINGFHTINFNNGDRYTGHIENNVMHGSGTYFFANGDRFEGQFENGKKQGIGTYIFKNGGKKVREYNKGIKVRKHKACTIS